MNPHMAAAWACARDFAPPKLPVQEGAPRPLS